MADTFSQIYIHIVFSVRNRRRCIPAQHKFELFKYMAGIIARKGHKPISINGVEDHVHLLVGLRPFQSISDLVRDIKANSNAFVKAQSWLRGSFQWQNGFGAFSYSHSDLQKIIHYIENQEAHHKRCSFREEYERLIRAFDRAEW